MSIRTPRSEPITARVLREQVVALSDLCGSGHRMTGAVAASPRRAVEVPGLWTPGRRRAGSEGPRGGRPQALGNLAGDRCRPSLRRGPRDSHTPTAVIILAMINREDEGVTSQQDTPYRSPRTVQTTETTSDDVSVVLPVRHLGLRDAEQFGDRLLCLDTSHRPQSFDVLPQRHGQTLPNPAPRRNRTFRPRYRTPRLRSR